MRPQKLEIEGVHSFLERQTIDFASLGASGLFGIFGDTGSGKSTILDSIILALYGEIPGEHASQFIHLKSGSALVVLDFLLRGTVYRVERSFKFNGRRDKVTASARLVELAGGTILCEQSNRVTETIEGLLGLGLKDFCKVVALPQGEFSEFLKASSGEQTAIAGRLFALEQYGDELFRRANAKYMRLKQGAEELDARIGEFGDVGPERIAAETEALKSAGEQSSRLVRESAEATERLHVLKHDFDLTGKLNQAQIALGEREAKQAGTADLLKLAEKRRECEQRILPAQRARDEAKRRKSDADRVLSAAEQALEQVETEASELSRRRAAAEEALVRDRERIAAETERCGALSNRREAFEDAEKKLSETRERFRSEKAFCEEKRKRRSALERELSGIAEECLSAENERRRLTAELSGIVNEEFLSGLKSCFRGELADASRRYPGAESCFTGTGRMLDGARSDDSLLKLYTELSERIQTLGSARSEREREIGVLTAEIKHSESEQEKITSEGREARSRSDEIAAGLSALGFRNFAELEAASERRKSALSAREKEFAALQTSEREAQKRFSESASASAAARAARIALDENLGRAEAELAEKLVGFGDESEVGRVLALDFSAEEMIAGAKALEQEIAEIRVEIRTLASSRGREVSAEELRACESLCRELAESAAAAGKDCAAREARLASLTELSARRETLEAKRRTLGKKLDVVGSICQAIRGKALMKFAVEEYLREICRSASAILGGITGGSYRLVYENLEKNECGFFVVDNRNNGERRSVVTLSGGETFLVSLSLAVSLSEAVALGGSNRVEFFFLDEGFGSLDNRLCDVVLDALYRLKENRFVIGLISHVEGLKERIESKLYVEFDETRGSRVKV